MLGVLSGLGSRVTKASIRIGLKKLITILAKTVLSFMLEIRFSPAKK